MRSWSLILLLGAWLPYVMSADDYYCLRLLDLAWDFPATQVSGLDIQQP